MSTLGNRDLRLFSAFVVLVMLTFGATSSYLRHRARAIDTAALDISENAAPSIVHLSIAQRDLKELQIKVREYVGQADRGIFPSTKELTDLRERIHQENQMHAQTPEFPGEHLASEQVNRELVHLDHTLDQFIAAYTARDLQTARRFAFDELQEAARHVVDRIMDAITINAEHSSERAERIRALRNDVARSSAVLNILAVLWTIALVAMLVIAVRRSALREAMHRLATERAAELELFAGRVAHDLRNPTAVLTYLLTPLEAGPTKEQLAPFVARARANLQRIEQILDALLRFACAGARPEPGVSVEVGAVVSELETELRAQAATAGVELRVEPFAPCRVACSQGILNSLLTNLAQNAIKYMGDGAERRIVIRVLDQGTMFRFEVEDTGPGLPIELQRVVFQPHVRAHGTAQEGYGLGLATVCKAAEAHGGKVGLRSVPGHGALFWFELPRA